MTELKDYLYIPSTDINEGMNTGTITKASLFMTPSHIFIIPHGSIGVMGNVAKKTKFTKTKEYIDSVLAKIKDISLQEFEADLFQNLERDRIFDISKLSRFTVKVGFWIFGGMYLRKHGGSLKVFNIQPCKRRAQIKEFYQLED